MNKKTQRGLEIGAESKEHDSYDLTIRDHGRSSDTNKKMEKSSWDERGMEQVASIGQQ